MGVIGSGVIANRFVDYLYKPETLIFAGNLHDSSAIDEEKFQEEAEAVKSAIADEPNATFVYFSTCSILDADPQIQSRPYVRHQISIEHLIQRTAESFLIVRVPQVIGLANASSAILSFLTDSILNQNSFELWQGAEKNIIDIDDVHEIVGELLKQTRFRNQIVNVASRSTTPLLELVNEIEEWLGVSAKYEVVNKGASFNIDTRAIEAILVSLKIDFGDNYIKHCLNKYYRHLIKPRKLLSVIVPTYNEEQGIEEFYQRLKFVLVNLAPRFEHEIIFVNDYSTDNTIDKLRVLARKDTAVKLINFSRNFGNQIGITAGVDCARGDIAVVIDDDLQDPPEIIRNFIAKWDKGYKVVYGVRPKRKGVNPIFRLMASVYYRVVDFLSETSIPRDTGDFRLIDRKVIEFLKLMKEENRYYRGLVAWVGFPQIGVVYERDERFAGVSTFSFKKYVNFALNGLTSFTEKPLYFSSVAGLFITVVSFILALVLIANKILDPSISIRGWTSITVMILFFGGIQLVSIGIVGIYISKIYREVKGRPLYIVESSENIELEDERIE